MSCGGNESAVEGGGDAMSHDSNPDAPTDGNRSNPDGSPSDAAAPDGNPSDTSVPEVGAPFACGPMNCNPGYYCSISTGLVSPDGGVHTGYMCVSLPPACYPTPVCGCIKTVGPCSCADSSGDITVTCSF